MVGAGTARMARFFGWLQPMVSGIKARQQLVERDAPIGLSREGLGRADQEMASQFPVRSTKTQRRLPAEAA